MHTYNVAAVRIWLLHQLIEQISRRARAYDFFVTFDEK